MNLSNRKRFLLVLDERVCWSRSAFDYVNKYIVCKGELKQYHAKFYVQFKVRERDKIRTSDSNNNNDENAKLIKNDYSSA